MKRFAPIGMFLFCVCSVSALAAKDGAVPTPTLTDLNGDQRQPLEVGNKLANVLIFVRTDCPISNSYAPEIDRLVRQYGPKKIEFYIVYAMRDLSPAAARDHVKQYGLICPAVIDRRHELVKAVGATVTPEAAVVGLDGKLVYRGRIDDLYAGLGKQRTIATAHELRDALDAVVEGRQPAVSRTKSVGCAITDD